jgi:phage-related protein
MRIYVSTFNCIEKHLIKILKLFLSIRENLCALRKQFIKYLSKIFKVERRDMKYVDCSRVYLVGKEDQM